MRVCKMLFTLLLISLFLYAISFNSAAGRIINLAVAAPVRSILGAISSVVPFSLFEVSLLCSPILIALAIIYVAVGSSGVGRRFIKVLSLISAIPSVYILTLGIACNFPPRLTYPDESIGLERLSSAAEILISNIEADADSAQQSCRELRREFSELYGKNSHAIGLEYQRLPNIKPILFKGVASRCGILAYYSFPTGEINLNFSIPAYMCPFVVAHEYAHYLGVVDEGDANVIAYLVSVRSNNGYVRYSANLTALEYVLADVRAISPTRYAELYKKLPAAARCDILDYAEFSRRNYSGRTYALSERLHDSLVGANQAHSYSSISLYVADYLVPS